MSNKTTKITAARSSQSLSPAGYLAEEYQRWQHPFDDHLALIQRFFEAQACSLTDALLQPTSQARFSLPDRIIPGSSSVRETPIPAFVVLAVRKKLVKVEQDTRLNHSTRNHILAELRMLATAFQPIAYSQSHFAPDVRRILCVS